MHVLHVISNLDLRKGGTSKTAIDLTRAQAAAGLRVTLFANFGASDQLDDVSRQIRAAGVALELVGPVRGKLQSHPETPTVLRKLLGAGVDVVHIHALWEDAQHRAAVEARRAGVPYVWLPQGMLDPWSLSQSALKKKIMLAWRTRGDLNGAASMHFTTDVERDLVAPLKLRPPVIIEPLGLDFAEFANLPPAGEFVTKFPQLAGKRIVLFLSRVHHKKGLDLLFPAFARAGGPNDVLVIAGPVADGYQPEIDRLIDAAGVRDRTLMAGMLWGRERLAAMVDATIFVLPSYQENFGIAVAEAVAVGCPTIISDQVNIWKELQSVGGAGIVQTNVDSVATMMEQWLADESLRRQHAQRGREFARLRYDWTQIAQRWAGHYRTLAAGGKSS